jgi:DNA (cytosine-5)-methyltransferase 1
MMGLPEGWVTDPAIGISRNEQLKACGNGVVPQQAIAALSDMLQAFQDLANDNPQGKVTTA